MAKIKKVNKNNTLNYRVNNEIYIEGTPMVRLVNAEGESEICHISKAKDIARECGLDLIEIAPTAQPPVVKIGDFSKFLYEQKKKAKQQNNHVKPVKEIQLRPCIASNDLLTKVNHAKEFIKNGSKVKVVLCLRGREKARREENKKSLYEFITLLDEVATPESMPKDEGDSKTIVYLKKKN